VVDDVGTNGNKQQQQQHRLYCYEKTVVWFVNGPWVIILVNKYYGWIKYHLYNRSSSFYRTDLFGV
jgi:hypothetical protein